MFYSGIKDTQPCYVHNTVYISDEQKRKLLKFMFFYPKKECSHH